MITLITGTPGAGKTLYAIAKLLKPVIGTTVTKKNDDGSTEEITRIVYTNINGLQLEHETISSGGDWVQDAKRAWQFQPIGEGQGLRDWHKWAKPGSLIVYDEFQKVWPTVPNGTPIPPDIQALDTHRHLGVDFILITQSPINYNRHIQGLIGRHLHVRRMGNLGLTVVYEWDHCSKQLMYSKSISKAPWRYDKSIFNLYKSAEVHTKTPRRIPTLAFVVLFALAGSAYLIPTFAARLAEYTEVATQTLEQNPITGEASASGEAANQTAPADDFDFLAYIPRLSHQPNSAPAFDELRRVVNMPRIAGCISSSNRCICFTEQTTNAGLSEDECRDWMQNRPYDPYTEQPRFQPNITPAVPSEVAQTPTQSNPVGELNLSF